MKYSFLSDSFYEDYPHSKFPQIEQKSNRPYAHIHITLNNQLFCLPLRSNIDHPHAYFTNKITRSGIDYSKAVAITNDIYIDNTTKVFLRKEEFKKLLGKDYVIKKHFEKYIELYKVAKLNPNLPHGNDILKYSTLQYFEEFI